MNPPSFHFTETDVAIASAALRDLSDYLMSPYASSPSHKAHAIHYVRIADQLQHHSASFPVNDLRHICIALKFFIEDHPLDFKASQLLDRLALVCGFIDPVS